MSTHRTYRIANSQLTLDFGSVLDVEAEVVVSSDDYMLTMGGGVSNAIRSAGGNAVVLDAAKAVPREAGDVVVTTAGALSARYVFHVVTIGPGRWQDPGQDTDVAGLVRRVTRTCLELMPSLGVRSIVFPALGTGTARYPIEAAAAAMAEVINDVLRQSSWQLDVSIMLMSRTLATPMQFVSFYEEFAHLAPAMAAVAVDQVTPAAAPPPRRSQQAVSDLLSLEQQRQRIEQELVDIQQGKGDAAREARLRADLERNTDKRLWAAQREQRKRHQPAAVFISYAREDEKLRDKLANHLGGLIAGGHISVWTDGEIVPGQEWAPAITRHLDEADIILLLVTASFLGSTFIGRVELVRALERHRRDEATVIPVILRPADWQSAGLEGLQALPKDGKAVSTWTDQDTAFLDIAHGLRRVVDAWHARQVSPPSAEPS
jgi:O-acetyl-ADP-ribose deacetylase (regulator of RNase III)